jgi:hypothetical protein
VARDDPARAIAPLGKRPPTFLHPDLKDARPLMVVGAPRCGTRFVARTLNSHPAIRLHGEIPKVAMDHAIRFLVDTREFFATRPAWSTSWEQGRRDLLYGLWSTIVKSTARPGSGTLRWFGHKTPRHDQYWEFYRDFFSNHEVKYVFCMRSFIDHYLSMVSIAKHRNVNYNPQSNKIKPIAREYRASVTRYAAMKTALGDSVSLFLLDDLRDGGLEYVRVTLFEHLGIAVDEATLARIDAATPANPTVARGSRRTDLTAEEHAFLEQNPDLATAIEALRAARPLAAVGDNVAGAKGEDPAPAHRSEPEATDADPD